MKAYGQALGHRADDLYFSYVAYPESVKPYIPFVIESELVSLFQQANEGLMPKVNRGKR